MTEMELRQRYVATMESWLGMSKAKKTHKEIIDIYNTIRPIPRSIPMDYSMAYCAAGVSAAAQVNHITDIIPPAMDTGNLIAGFKKLGRWEENDAYIPTIGDLIIYNWDDNGKGDCSSGSSHVGAVKEASGGMIRVIECNMGANGIVGYRDIPINGRYIRGFCLPDYEGKAAEMNASFERLVIDVSVCQKGMDIAKAKRFGVQGVIVRVGENLSYDKCFDDFALQTEAAGLPMGAYWATHAKTAAAAKREAELTCAKLEGKNVRLPVYMDMEVKSLMSLDKRTLTDCVRAWADVIRANGYVPGLYTGIEWCKNHLLMDELQDVELWIALYSEKKPSIPCGMWQFGGGKINHFRSVKLAGKVVDQNYLWKNYANEEDYGMRYKYLRDLKADKHNAQYYVPTVEKLLRKGFLRGKGGAGDDTIIDLSEDMIRVYVSNDRAGLYGE